MSEYKKKQLDQYWLRLMEFGEKSGCHQRPDRSFFLRKYQMPVCARCTGVLLGYLIAIPVFFIWGFSKVRSFCGMLVMLTDWLLQATGRKESTNRRRLITGILGGYGIMSIELLFVRFICRYIKHIR